MSPLSCLLICSIFLHDALASIHLQNPRGSGNRLDEPNRERRNRRRLFDSQANDRQGYNVGNLYYYQGSKLQVEWTNQHSCGGDNANCEIILQYMCSNNVRDGAILTTIPDVPSRCENGNCDTDIKFGMHEDFESYKRCRLRSRNFGLFVGDIRMNRDGRARFTRQNTRGLRYGYECPEERDYYPYWHPTPWRDIAVLTNDVSRCDYYKAQSENVKGRGYCYIPLELLVAQDRRIRIPNNKADCDKFSFPANDPNGVKGVWKVAPSHGIAAPICQENQYSRDNHNGNGINGQTNTFNWTLPNIEEDNCIFRIRYNVTSNDFNGWETTSEQNADPLKRVDGAKVPLYKNLGFDSRCDASERGFLLKNDPEVKIFDGLDIGLKLAVDIRQAGRTFEDRSFRFEVRPRPAGIPADANIYNVNVRGKRGNIVQTYPSTEYDFVPADLHATPDDYTHLQWTGSNTNNNGNAGQGLRGTDRHNYVLLHEQIYPEGSGYTGPGVKVGHFGVNYPMNLTGTSLPLDMLEKLAYLKPAQLGGEMSELDDAGPYFDAGLMKAPGPGTYHYMCSRNNAFTNRDQKGRFIIHPTSPPAKRNLNSELEELLQILTSKS
ncbi:hypothetical protein SNE40_014825 [Patella caerulea]|uniref:Protein DD3-3 n=2 Tax=Patella caerulea TaxID=87958 RepID=A0AAN8PJR0_PATCE